METMRNGVTPRTRKATIRVRVLHTWWHNAGGKDPMLELILGDEQVCITYISNEL